jgi:hypothetical protein
MKYILFIIAFGFIFSVKSFWGILDLEGLCKKMYAIYDSDEVAAKKEVLAYKKLNELIGQTYTIKITTTDSISYDKKEDVSRLKSKEVYTSDAKTGYFGVFVIVSQKGDQLLMSTSPDKEMSITGTVKDVLVVGYIKNNTNQKAYTPIKEFDDKGTIIQQVILVVEM